MLKSPDWSCFCRFAVESTKVLRLSLHSLAFSIGRTLGRIEAEGEGVKGKPLHAPEPEAEGAYASLGQIPIYTLPLLALSEGPTPSLSSSFRKGIALPHCSGCWNAASGFGLIPPNGLYFPTWHPEFTSPDLRPLQRRYPLSGGDTLDACNSVLFATGQQVPKDVC